VIFYRGVYGLSGSDMSSRATKNARRSGTHETGNDFEWPYFEREDIRNTAVHGVALPVGNNSI
jgi:hypothetical protein